MGRSALKIVSSNISLSSPGQNTIDLSEIVGWLDEPFDSCMVKELGNFRIVRQKIDQLSLALRDSDGNGRKPIVRLTAAHLRSQSHHDGLGIYQAVSQLQIPFHIVGMNDQPTEHVVSLGQSSGAQTKNLG